MSKIVVTFYEDVDVVKDKTPPILTDSKELNIVNVKDLGVLKLNVLVLSGKKDTMLPFGDDFNEESEFYQTSNVVTFTIYIKEIYNNKLPFMMSL